MQGWRKANEDAHITALDIEPGVHFFAVFDGHGGCELAKFCEKHFVADLKADQAFQVKNYEMALRNTFLKIDKKLLSNDGKKELQKINKAFNQSQG